jgi:hypothetical protein
MTETTPSTNTDTRLEGFSDFVCSTMEAWKVPGLAVGIVTDGEVLFLEGFGVRQVGHKLPVTPHTLFALAFGTKAFTTMALALLAEEGKLDWDTPVRHYLPSFKLHDSVATERITPRDLVTHRSGLPRHDLVWYNSSHSREELVRRLQYLEPNKDLRSLWQYQNLMYMTAGYLVEHLTGLTWEQFVQQPAKYDELPHASYGLGWFIEPYRGHDFVHHGGNIDGFSTMTTFMPRDNLGVVLCNLNGVPVPWIVCLNAYERLLGLDQRPWNERLKQEQAEFKAGEHKGKEKSAENRIADTQPSHPLESYAGDYEHPGYGILSFKLDAGALQAQLNGMTLPVAHYHYDTFELSLERWDLRIKATFAANSRGDIDSMAAPFEQTVRDIVFTRVPDRAMSERSFLVQFVGDYELFGMPMNIVLKSDTTLLARLPGQPDVELVPRRGTEFLVKDLSGYSIEFVKDESGVVIEAIVTQPWGVFTAKKKNHV